MANVGLNVGPELVTTGRPFEVVPVERKALVLTEPTTTVRAIANKINFDGKEITRPRWTDDRLPIQDLTPIPKTLKPIEYDSYTLRPDVDQGIIYVAPSVVALLDFSLTIRRSVRPDQSIAITGGSALFTLTVYDTQGVELMARQRDTWYLTLRMNQIAEDNWNFRPEPRRGLQVSLELPPGVAASPPLIAASSVAGVATVAVELTETGALTWKGALEQGAGSTIPGVFHVATSVPGLDKAAFGLDIRSLDTTVGQLLAGKGAAAIRYVDPQQTIMGRLVVVTSDLVELTTMAVRPNQGQQPTNQVLGPAGGQVEVAVTTQDVGSVVMDWSAQVSFKPLGWAPIPVSGQLNAGNIWIDMIKPESWFANYMIMVIPVDSRGQAQTVQPGTTDQLQGVLNFTAPYVPNGLLNNSFFAGYLHPVSVALPRYPNQPFGQLVLTMFVTRNGLGGTGSRRLSAEELNVVALVYPDAKVEIRTTRDALPELSTASEMLGLLASMAGP
jgi:hypothetical protein